MPQQQPTILQRLERTSQRRNPELHRKPTPQQPTRLRWQDRLLISLSGVLAVLLLLVANRAEAQGHEAWGLTLEAGARRMHQLALDTSLHAEVSGLLARIHVVQRFRNDSEDWVEGTYRFPLPDGAAVDRLFIRVGSRVLEGEIRERETAERVYRQARDDGRAAGLVSQERANQFSTRMANIGPGDTVDVMIGYLVKVDYRDGAYRLRLPMTFTARHGSEPQPATERPAPLPQLAALGPLASLTSVGAAASHRLELKVDLDAGVPLANVESLHHDVDIQPAASGYTVRLLDPEARMDRAFELRWAPEYSELPRTSLTTFDDGEDVYAQLMLVPPRSEALEPLAREVIFVIDTSGSMEGASIAQARDALAEGLDALAPGDRFNLVEFNSETHVLFPAPVPVNAARLREAFEWLEDLAADGGTHMGPALEAALARPPSTGAGAEQSARADLLRQVVFITDGAVGNEQQLLQLIADQLGDSRLFPVAIGSAPNDWFMRKAAEIGRGHHTFIGRPEDVASTMGNLWAHLRRPAIGDVCVDWGMHAETYPEVIPDLYAGQPLWVVARLPREPDRVELCGTLNGEPWVVDAWPRIAPGPDLLATLWASHKVDALQESVMFGADRDWVQGEITQVALDHELLTPYTSLVAVDRQPARSEGRPLARGEIPGLLPAGAPGAAFPGTATGWKTQLLLSLLVLAISTYLFLRPFAPVPLLRRRLATRL